MQVASVALRVLHASVCMALAAGAFTPSPFLPDLLVNEAGAKVTTPAQWRARREELKDLVQQHITGTLPQETPALTSATLLNTSDAGWLTSCYIRLGFKANGTGVFFDIELAWDGAAAKAGEALPVMLTQWNHRVWGLQATQRGYITALYPGADTRDASGLFRQAYPAASFRKILARAFTASRVVDFLVRSTPGSVHGITLPAVDGRRLFITGQRQPCRPAAAAPHAQ